MRFVARKRVADDDRLLRLRPTGDDYDVVLRAGDEAVDEGGRLLLKIVGQGISRAAGAAMYFAIRDRIPATRNRGAAAGLTTQHRNKDGRLSSTSQSAPVDSGILGFFDRYPRTPYCRRAAFTEHERARYGRCLAALREASAVFRAHYPDAHARQAAKVANTHPDFVIPDTVFTTVTLNKNFATTNHRDAGDLPDGFGVMSHYRSGLYTGGLLVLPAYRVAAELESFDVVLFDPHAVHGNTALVPIGRGAYERITCVHYYRAGMAYCGSAAQELALAKAHDPRRGGRNMKAVPP